MWQENIAYWSPLFDLFTVCYHNAQNRKEGFTHWGEEKWVQSFDEEFWQKETAWDPDVRRGLGENVIMNLKEIKWDEWTGFMRLIIGACWRDDVRTKLWGFIKIGEFFFDWLTVSNIFKKNFFHLVGWFVCVASSAHHVFTLHSSVPPPSTAVVLLIARARTESCLFNNARSISGCLPSVVEWMVSCEAERIWRETVVT